MTAPYRFVATCPKGVERLLGAELRDLGAPDVAVGRAVVSFGGTLRDAYRVCLWSRCASRVLLALGEFAAPTADALYEGVAAVPWEDHVAHDGTLVVDVNGATSGLTHSGFAARKAKDAIVDRLRERTGARPSVVFERPDIRLNIRLHRECATLSLDLAGAPLHERGYRTPGEQVEAPLKENLAAALLSDAGWQRLAAEGGALVDPMCGSGTLLIEGALMAADQAPGLLRDHWGFSRWLGHDASAWHELLDEADDRAETGRASLPPMTGRDISPHAIALGEASARRAGLGGAIVFEHGEVGGAVPPHGATRGLVITNPPYGVRLGEVADLGPLYATLGERLIAAFGGWRAAVFTAEESLARATGLRSDRVTTFYNGTIETRLYHFAVSPGRVRAEVRRAPEPRSPGAEVFGNRLRKNARHLGKWARREGVTCYRLYDADLPDFAVAVDRYEGAGADAGRLFAHVAEYAPPSSVDPARAEERLREAVAVVAEVLEVAPADVAVKVRRRQRGTSQYERQDERGQLVEVAEGGLRFLVDLYDHLDTGLFLDHRPVRAMIRDRASGRRFANLFAYTGTASVYAAAGGATAINTVDLSAPYLDRARRNMALNGFDEIPKARFFNTDALRWLAEERRRVEAGEAAPYGLVYLDPPTFSTSKRMAERTLDVQRDHVALIDDAASLLDADGVLIFSTNLRTFELDAGGLRHLSVTDITPDTIPPDFARNPRIHRCYLVRRA